MSSDDTISNEEWENRQLCSDGSCIGVIGPDGLCKECGQPGAKAEIPKAEIPPPSDSTEASADQDGAPDTTAEKVEAGASGPEAPEDDDEWANRRLCPDGNCIGVIGPDGNCKECGRPAE